MISIDPSAHRRCWQCLILWLSSLAALSLSAQAQQKNGETRTRQDIARRLTVTGRGEVRIQSDKADITLGVVTEDPSSRAAASANADASQKVQDAVMKMGVAKKDIQTLQYSVQAIYSPPPVRPEQAPRPPRIVAYRVSNQVRVTVRSLSSLGDLIDAVTAAGSNSIENIAFSKEDQDSSEDDALRKAVADARRKADQMAKAAGVRIKDIYEMNEGEIHRPYPITYARSAFAADKASTPIQPGEVTVTANVTVVYELDDTMRTVNR